MADYIVESRMWLPKPRAEVFAFFTDPANLPRVTPPWLGLRVIGTPPALAAGATFDLRITWRGVPFRWRTFIREYDPPFRFLDVQVRGPYARWEHRHLFRVRLRLFKQGLDLLKGAHLEFIAQFASHLPCIRRLVVLE